MCVTLSLVTNLGGLEPVGCAAVTRPQMTVFFSKAKTAVIIGLVILFGSVFPDIAVEGGSVSSASKVSQPSNFRMRIESVA